MSIQRVPVAPATRRVVPVPLPLVTTIAPPGAVQIGFHGSARTDRETIVHAVCWPMLASVWPTLTQGWAIIKASRGEPATGIPAGSWLAQHSRQLSRPFRDTGAGESTIAALLNRTAIGIAISVHEAQPGESTVHSAPEQGMVTCLSAYQAQITQQKRQPIRQLIVAAGQGLVNRSAMNDCRRRFADQPWIQQLEVTEWKDSDEPLPLELARVIAGAVARHSDDPQAPNPIIEAIRPKLANPPPQWQNAVKVKRR